MNHRLRVMTFNLLREPAHRPSGGWPRRREALIRIVARWDPDIAGLQEASPRQIDDLAGALPHLAAVRGPSSGPGRLPSWSSLAIAAGGAGYLLAARRRRKADRTNLEAPISGVIAAAGALLAAAEAVASRRIDRRDDGGEFCPILYRRGRFREIDRGAFWLSPRPRRAGSVLPGSWLPRILSWVRLEEPETGRRWTAANTHVDFLPWALPRSGRLRRRWLDRNWDGSPQIALGDFNASPTRVLRAVNGETAFRKTAPPDLIDAWTAAERRDGPAITYRGPGSLSGRLDSILFRPAGRVARVVTVVSDDGEPFPSDHCPVVADIDMELDFQQTGLVGQAGNFDGQATDFDRQTMNFDGQARKAAGAEPPGATEPGPAGERR